MPKVEIDYSNTIIYKITCKNEEIKDVYVGHTTNFVQRKHGHKQSCLNPKSSSYMCKLYKTIRNNGGWDNWEMEIVNFYNCANHYEARVKEQEYFISLNATLNGIEPMPSNPAKIKAPRFICTTCKFKCSASSEFDVHNQSKKHIDKMANLTDNIENDTVSDKGSNKFICEKCGYASNRLSQYNRHLITPKHMNNDAPLENKVPKSSPKIYSCICAKMYNDRAGLWRHKKKCTGEKEKGTDPALQLSMTDSNNNSSLNNNLIIEVIKQNQEFKAILIEQCKQPFSSSTQMPETNAALIMELLKQNNEFKELLIEQNKTILELARKSGNSMNNA